VVQAGAAAGTGQDLVRAVPAPGRLVSGLRRPQAHINLLCMPDLMVAKLAAVARNKADIARQAVRSENPQQFRPVGARSSMSVADGVMNARALARPAVEAAGDPGEFPKPSAPTGRCLRG
jgi:hypothetical protein